MELINIAPPLIITLPYPPSINHYWEQRGAMRFLSKKALNFRRDVKHEFWATKHIGFSETNRLCVQILLVPPDKRRRDIDNVLKSLLDALEHAGVYPDDSQIDMLSISRVSGDESRAKVEVSVIGDKKGLF